MSDFCQLTGQERLFNPRIPVNDREFTAGVDGFGNRTSQCRIQRREVDWRIDIPRLSGPGFRGRQLLIQQQIFGQFEDGEILINTLLFEHAFYCKLTGGMASTKSSPAGNEDKIFLSGTKVREMLSNGKRPPAEFTRPEVADILIASYAQPAQA